MKKNKINRISGKLNSNGIKMYKKVYYSILAFLLTTSTVFAGPGEPQGFANPLDRITTLRGFINVLLEVVVRLGTIVVIFFIIYSGYLFVIARGNEQKLTDAKRAFLWTIVGAAILLGAQVLSLVISGTIDELGGPSSF